MSVVLIDSEIVHHVLERGFSWSHQDFVSFCNFEFVGQGSSTCRREGIFK